MIISTVVSSLLVLFLSRGIYYYYFYDIEAHPFVCHNSFILVGARFSEREHKLLYVLLPGYGMIVNFIMAM